MNAHLDEASSVASTGDIHARMRPLDWAPLDQRDAVAFAVHHRPVRGTRGVYRVNLRHGFSRVRSGHRHTLGVIFHDAF